MVRRMSIVATLLVAIAVAAAVGFWTGPRAEPGSVVSAQTQGGTWNSTTIWRPNLADAGLALAEFVNQIDATCFVDVDPITSTNGAGPEGPVYAFAVTWSC